MKQNENVQSLYGRTAQFGGDRIGGDGPQNNARVKK
jgi:hypothetical protein